MPRRFSVSSSSMILRLLVALAAVVLSSSFSLRKSAQSSKRARTDGFDSPEHDSSFSSSLEQSEKFLSENPVVSSERRFKSTLDADLAAMAAVSHEAPNEGASSEQSGEGVAAAGAPGDDPAAANNGKEDEEQLVCPFHAYNDNVRGQPRVAMKRNVLFHQGSTVVVEAKEEVDGEEALSRYMLFKKADGKCHEEAMVRCNENAVDDGSSSSSSSFQEGSPACGNHVCRPRAEIALSYARSMVAGGLTSAPQASRAFLIGVGGGMIPLWVQEARPALQLDAVDVAEDVLAAAPCFGLPAWSGGSSSDGGGSADEQAASSQGSSSSFLQGRAGAAIKSNVNLVLEDGRSFLERQPENTYDLVLMDAFTPKDKVPPCLSTLEFLKEVKARMRPGGVLVWNMWKNEERQLLETVSAVFPDLAMGRAPGEGNAIVLASDGSNPLANLSGGDEDDDDVVTSWFRRADFHQVSTSTTEQIDAATPVDDESCFGCKGPRKDAQWCPERVPKTSSE